MARPRTMSDEEILQVARTCFLEQGAAVSTQVIAEAAGLSQAAIFKRFGTKEQLMVRALAPPPVPSFAALVEAGPDERPVPEQLTEILFAIFAFVRTILPGVSILRAQGVDFRAILEQFDVPPPVLGHRLLSGWFSRALEGGRIRPVAPEAMALMLMGSVQARLFTCDLLGTPLSDEQIERYVQEVVCALWDGVRPGEDR